MAREIFLDTSGSLTVRRSLGMKGTGEAAGSHGQLRDSRRQFITTDYVLDETATPFRMRGQGHLVEKLFDIVFSSRVCRVEWMDSERFMTARAFFMKHQDQQYSFTDCFSFCMMAQFRLSEALTKDAHFREAGFVALLE